MRLHALLLPLLLPAPGIALGQTDGTCQPTGGKAALDKMFEQELRYPEEALAAGLKGEVVITALLGPEGEVRDLRVGKGLSPACDAEALRLVRMVLWGPATAGERCSGKEHHLAVPFDPGRYKRWAKGRVKHAGERFALPADTGSAVLQPKQLDAPVEPAIPGGMAGLPAYIGREMRYPGEAMRYSLEGTVKLGFVVEPSGTLSNMQVLQSVGGGCTDEAMRLIYRTAWQPGLKDGRRVRSALAIPIRFDLPKERR